MRALERRFLAGLLAATFTLAAAPGARAEPEGDVDRARQLFREASKLATAERWAEAESLYTESLQIKRAAITLYSLGVVQRENGHLVDALRTLRAFIDAPSSPSTARFEAPAREAIDELERAVGPLELTPDGGVGAPALALDGAKAPDPAPPPAAIPPVAQLPIEVAVPRAFAAPLPAPAAQAQSRAPFVLLGTGAVLFAGGLCLGIVGVSEAAGAPTSDGPIAEAASAKAVAADVIGGAGLAVATIGVVMLLTQGSTGGRERTTSSQRYAMTGDGVRVKF